MDYKQLASSAFMHAQTFKLEGEFAKAAGLERYIGYSVDTDIRVAMWFGAINFSNDKYTFGKAIWQVICDCFVKFGMNVIEWSVVCGNPAEKSYDRLCKKFGGRVVGVRRKRAKDLAGNLHDDKIYEIEKEDFLRVAKSWMKK